MDLDGLSLVLVVGVQGYIQKIGVSVCLAGCLAYAHRYNYNYKISFRCPSAKRLTLCAASGMSAFLLLLALHVSASCLARLLRVYSSFLAAHPPAQPLTQPGGYWA